MRPSSQEGHIVLETVEELEGSCEALKKIPGQKGNAMNLEGRQPEFQLAPERVPMIINGLKIVLATEGLTNAYRESREKLLADFESTAGITDK